MSTKTLRKRIALVAVSALGFGLLSVAPSSAASTAITVTGIARAGVGMQLTVTADDATDTSYVHYVKTGTLPTGGVLAGDPSPVALVAGTKKIEIAEDNNNDFVAGTYNLLVWINSTSTTQTAPAVGDISARVAITVAGAPTAISLTAPTAAVSAGTAVNAKFVASVTDANGVATLLASSDESIAVRATYSVGAVEINEAIGSGTEQSLATATTTALSSTNATASGGSGFINNWTFYLDNSLATNTTVAVSGAGLLTGITGASATLTTIAKTFPTLVHVNGGAAYSATSVTAGNTLTSGAYVQATDASSGSVSITASTTAARSITFRLTGTAGDSFDYTVAATSTTVALPTGITAGTYTTSAIAASATTVDFTITATAAAAASGYKVTIPVTTTTNVVYTITYEAPVVGGSYGTVTMSPTSATSAKALIGSSVHCNSNSS
jgi:trimeric autotransporter adhesin